MAPFKPRLLRPPRSKLNSRLRSYGLTSKEILEIWDLEKQLKSLIAMKVSIESSVIEDLYYAELTEIYGLIRTTIAEIAKRKLAPVELKVRGNFIPRKFLRIDDLDDTDSRVMINFRFLNKAQLHEVYLAFQFPDRLRHKRSGNVFTGEEVFLVGMFRIHGPVNQNDDFYYLRMGLRQEQVSMCLNCFLDHIVGEWGYLITNHLDFFKSYFKSMCNAARRKLLASRGLDVAPPDDPDGYVFPMFLDNSIIGCARAG